MFNVGATHESVAVPVVVWVELPDDELDEEPDEELVLELDVPVVDVPVVDVLVVDVLVVEVPVVDVPVLLVELKPEFWLV